MAAGRGGGNGLHWAGSEERRKTRPASPLSHPLRPVRALVPGLWSSGVPQSGVGERFGAQVLCGSEGVWLDTPFVPLHH